MKKLLFFVLILPLLGFSQHTISGVFSPPEDYKNAILYKITPTDVVYMAHAPIKEDGSFEFKTDSTYTKGIYKLIYAVPKEEHSFDILYNGKEDIEFIYSLSDGIEFKSSVENILSSSYTKSMGRVSQSITKYFKDESTDTLALKTIFNTQRETQFNYENAAKDTDLAIHFIKANTPFIPEHFSDVNTYILNLKAHYYDYIDFKNETLLSSDFLIDRVFNYVLGMSSDKDPIVSYKLNIDDSMKAMKEAEALTQSTILELLWQQFAQAGYDELANYITDNYLLEITEKLNNDTLKQQSLEFKKTSIGQVAPDFLINEVSKTKLSDLNDAENYLLVFWGSTCGHCLDELPQLQEFLKSKPQVNLKVIAFAIEQDDKIWQTEHKNFPEFIHVLGLEKWNNAIVRQYNVLSTPNYFLLDKDKTIIVKPEDFKALKSMFEN